MPSPLSFSATQLLRNKLLVRNLTPYTKPGVYTPTSSPAPGDFIQNATLNDQNIIQNFNCNYGCGIFELSKK